MQLHNKRILVTGGAGFIGSNLVDELCKTNDVIVLDDCSTGHEKNLREAKTSGRVRFIKDSILNQSVLDELIPQVDVIYHLAVQCLRICFDKPHLVDDVNVTGTLNLLETAYRKNPNLERFIYVSSSEAYGTAETAPMSEDHVLKPTTVYGASKLGGELYTRAYHITYGMPTMIVRPFNTYGYREHYEGTSGEVIPRFVIRILNNLSPIVFGDGSATRDFTFVTDTVKGLIAAGECDKLIGEAVNVAYGEEVSIKTIAQLLLKALSREDLGIEHIEDRPGDVHRHYADITKMSNATGFRPSINIEEGLKKYVAWFKSYYDNPEAMLAECQTKNWQVSTESENAHAKVSAPTAG